jgi:transposase-like protein
VLGLWVGTGGEGAKHWMTVLTELKNRGVADVLIACCDGLKGLPEAIGEVWPLATVQGCVVHLVRSSLRYASRAHWSAITKALRTVYTAPTAEDAEARFDEFEQDWGAKYPAIIRLWRSAWEQFTPFLAFPPEIRKIIYTTNAVESPVSCLHSRFRPTSVMSRTSPAILPVRRVAGDRGDPRTSRRGGRSSLGLPVRHQRQDLRSRVRRVRSVGGGQEQPTLPCRTRSWPIRWASGSAVMCWTATVVGQAE